LRRVVDWASVIILVARHGNIIANANKKEMVKTNKNTLLIEVKKTELEM
jgi:S-adenosylmethionine hydrolase